jgi:hypothetical protein
MEHLQMRRLQQQQQGQQRQLNPRWVFALSFH